jgi:ADP-ribosylglycohydrolase
VSAATLAGAGWHDRLNTARPPGKNGSRGAAVSTVLDAWWCITNTLGDLEPGSLERVCRLAVARSSDPDTVGAIVGALVGALSLPPADASRIHGGTWTGSSMMLSDLSTLARSAALAAPL